MKTSKYSSILTFALITVTAQAATISEIAYTNDIGVDVSGNFSIAYQIQNANTDVLVFGTYIDNSANPTIDTLNFGDISGVNTAANDITNMQRVSLSYFFNPDQSAGLTINGSATGGATDSGYFIIELTGVDTGVAANVTTGDKAIASINTSSENRFILDIAGRNGDITLTPDTIAGSVLNKELQGGNGGSAAIGQATAESAGSHQLGWDPVGSGSQDYGEIAYAFANIPEPTTYALALGVASLLLLARRRKA